MRGVILTISLCIVATLSLSAQSGDYFPDGSKLSEWFLQRESINIESLGKLYVVTEYGVQNDRQELQTEALQAVIELAAESGGVVVIPKGVYHSGALFFRPKTHLHLCEGAVLKGSDDISHFPILRTRIEGQTLDYFSAFINADGVDGFTISGRGVIDGNGERYWRSFWLRRRVNPDCTNMDELRPRLLYISNSKDIRIEGITLQNSPFWTCHLYRVERAKIQGVKFFAPAEPIKAPSSDAIDIDACSDIVVRECYLSVNDDAIALKGGKGPWADQDPNNGANERILIEDCTFGFCHSCLTCGSESIHNRNILMRRIKVDRADRLLWLKMRPDTPQNYEFITIEDIVGNAKSFLYIHPWRQFFDLKGRADTPLSYGSNICMRSITLECKDFLNVEFCNDQYKLSNFIFEELNIVCEELGHSPNSVEGFSFKNVKLNGKIYHTNN